jgi:hypothetical protein
MKTENKKNTGKFEEKNVTEKKPKSKIILAREKYPEGIGYIVNMRAILR